MASSQALTISVFGTIMQRDDLYLLNSIRDDNGEPLLHFELKGKPEFDYKVNYLNEPTPTQVDFFIPSIEGNIAIECKLAENEFGPCSQVTNGKCDGNYSEKPELDYGERCYLSKIGVDYWKHIPHLFRWKNNADYSPCPIRKPYQLIRTVLAAAVSPDTQQVWGQPVAVLVYDARNPVFMPGGEVDGLFRNVKEAFDGPAAVKRTTWQSIAGILSEHSGYNDLLTWLNEKFGIC